MFCTEIMPKCNQAEEFIYGYLSEFKSEILPYFKSDTINKYCFVTDNIIEKREAAKRALQLELRSKISSGGNNGAIFWDAWDRVDSLGYGNLFNSGIYNLCMLIISIDESLNMDEEIIIENATGEYEKCEKLIQCKMEGISMIHLGPSEL